MNRTWSTHKISVCLFTWAWPWTDGISCTFQLLYYTKHGSAWYIVCEVCSLRERERGGGGGGGGGGRGVTIVAAKIAVNSHFPEPETHTFVSNGLYCGPCQKFLLFFPPLSNDHDCGSKFTLSVAKKSLSSFRPSQMAQRVIEEPRTGERLNGCTVTSSYIICKKK